MKVGINGMGRIGRLALQAGREREFANLYRASDAARRLSDEDFAEVLQFTQAPFAMALAFRAGKAVSGPAAQNITIAIVGFSRKRTASAQIPCRIIPASALRSAPSTA